LKFRVEQLDHKITLLLALCSRQDHSVADSLLPPSAALTCTKIVNLNRDLSRHAHPPAAVPHG
jgi:hypothetical protein